jgi:hypothetical protein
MRIWSIHPRHLDRQGLLAAWREGLLAQKVLAGKTKGYRHHPQLLRFRERKNPLEAVGAYLAHLAADADRRGYTFDRSKILRNPRIKARFMAVTRGQLEYETSHLLKKLRRRDPELYRRLRGKRCFDPHPIFRTRKGKIEPWERR